MLLSTTLLTGSVNSRDLAGVVLNLNGQTGRINPGRLMRGESFHLLQDEAVVDVLGLGVSTVVDLRGADEALRDGAGDALLDAVQAGKLDRHLVDFTPSSSWKLTPAGQDPYNHLGEAYTQCLVNGLPGLSRALEAFLQNGGGLYVHCAIGKDRTGVAVASILYALGASREDILEDFAATRAAMPALSAKLAGNSAFPEFADPSNPLLVPNEQAVEQVLDWSDKAGGMQDLLARQGFDYRKLSALFNTLTG